MAITSLRASALSTPRTAEDVPRGKDALFSICVQFSRNHEMVLARPSSNAIDWRSADGPGRGPSGFGLQA